MATKAVALIQNIFAPENGEADAFTADITYALSTGADPTHQQYNMRIENIPVDILQSVFASNIKSAVRSALGLSGTDGVRLFNLAIL